MNDPQPEGHMASHIERRTFLATLLGSAAAWPLAARAQQPKVPVIGFVTSLSARDFRQTVAGFHRGLNEAAFMEGQYVAIEYRWAAGLLAHQIRQNGPHALGVQSRSVVESAMLMLHSGRPYGTDSSRQRQDHARRPSCYTAIEGFDPRAR